MGSADTGARERLAEVVRRNVTPVCMCEWDDSPIGEIIETSPDCGIHGDGANDPLKALDELVALAADAGVPPHAAPADVQRRLNTHTDSELTKLLADVSIAVALRRDVPPHQVLREAEASYGWPESDWPKVREHVKGWLAGVGEAHPVEPLCACGHPKDGHADCGTGPCRSNLTLALWHDSNDRQDRPCTCRSYHVPVETQPVAGELIDGLRASQAECGRLREQLDAARVAMQNAQGVALNGPPDRPQQRLYRIDELLTAALGVVGPPPDEGGALGQKASETRADAEAEA